jgi:hypothetical protein
MAGDHKILLDPAIRDWVLIPIMVIMFLMGLLRNNVTKLLRKDVMPTREKVKQNNQLMRARRLRANAHFIPFAAFQERKKFFCEKEKGILMQKMDAPNPMAQMQDPSMMMNMMQGNFAMMVPQMAMMGVVNYFFQGFVIGKVPFPLTPSFKEMLQRGVNLKTLDTAYISSMAFYFLVMFGMRGLFSLVLGANNDTDDTKMMQAQMGMGAAQPGQEPDMGKIFAGEAENLQLIEHQCYVDGAEDRLLKLAAAGVGAPGSSSSRPKAD